MMPVPMYMGGSFDAPLLIHQILWIIHILLICVMVYMLLEMFGINEKIGNTYKRIKFKINYMLKYKERKNIEKAANEVINQSKRLNKK